MVCYHSGFYCMSSNKIRNFIKGKQTQGDSEDAERRKRYLQIRDQGGFEGGGRESGGGRRF